ncbi:ATP-binding cassette domain-containing protein [Bowdeniella massiliensis]|uniref:ATP-binding cassette domain-containing protein n=1 Tax=Bowdeniella massiliensis TaxID=2932264 RepID=UPI002028C97E|nr:ATP-binding cassette domain-containing protein [Bowdeniella massiliensis]
MNNDIIVDAQHVSRTYGSGSQAHTAVRDASLQIRRGELFAILGTNGAGKTSLMEVLEGPRPTSPSPKLPACGAAPSPIPSPSRRFWHTSS